MPVHWMSVALFDREENVAEVVQSDRIGYHVAHDGARVEIRFGHTRERDLSNIRRPLQTAQDICPSRFHRSGTLHGTDPRGRWGREDTVAVRRSDARRTGGRGVETMCVGRDQRRSRGERVRVGGREGGCGGGWVGEGSEEASGIEAHIGVSRL